MSAARRAAALAALVVFAAATVATATEPLKLRPGMGGVPDPGALRCASLNEVYEAGPTGFRQMLLYWTEGYIYGQSGQPIDAVLATAPGGPWTFDSLTDRLVGFCQRHPDATVPAAAEDLWRALRP